MSEILSGDEEIEMEADAPNLRCRDLTRTFTDAGEALTVLDAVDLDVASGESVAILGASGSGKSTLLHLLGGLDGPTRGSVRIRGQAMHRLSDTARGRLRNRTLGFVYQFHHLLPEFSALENVAMPLLIRRTAAREALASARELLGRVGLGDRLSHRPAQLSGGERQRAAVARALVTRPALVLADEPTGNLDAVTGARVLDLMLELNREMGASLVVVTHDEGLAERMQTRYRLTAGHLVREAGGLSA